MGKEKRTGKRIWEPLGKEARVMRGEGENTVEARGSGNKLKMWGWN